MSEEVSSDVNVLAVMEDLRALTVRFPVDAIRTIQGHRALFIPHLIQSIERSCDRMDAGEPQEEGQAAFIALFLLTEFSAFEAWPSFLRVLHLKNEGSYELYGDTVSEVFPRMLARFAQGKPDILDELIDNPHLDYYVRSAASRTYSFLVRDQHLTREEAVEALRRQLRTAIDRGDQEKCTALGCELLNYCPTEALEEYASAFQKDLIDTSWFDNHDVRRAVEDGIAGMQDHIDLLEPTGILDTVEDLEWWECFQDPDDEEPLWTSRPKVDPYWPQEVEALNDQPPADEPLIHQLERGMGTIRNPTAKVGRNDPCPCGSGVKYKKCCGAG